MQIHGVICTARVYKFEDWLFEVPAHSSPWPLKRDGEPRARAGRKFWEMYDKFSKLSDEEKKQYIFTDGGCHRF